MNVLKGFYKFIIQFGSLLQSLYLLLIRILWGYLFFITGTGKFHQIAKTTEFFSSLDIPFPEFNVYLVGLTETIGGFCLMIGLAARLVSIPLIITMIVALLTASYHPTVGILQDPQGFISQTPITFLMTCLTVFCFGPGKISLDAIIKGLFFKQEKKPESETPS